MPISPLQIPAARFSSADSRFSVREAGEPPFSPGDSVKHITMTAMGDDELGQSLPDAQKLSRTGGRNHDESRSYSHAWSASDSIPFLGSKGRSAPCELCKAGGLPGACSTPGTRGGAHANASPLSLDAPQPFPRFRVAPLGIIFKCGDCPPRKI